MSDQYTAAPTGQPVVVNMQVQPIVLPIPTQMTCPHCNTTGMTHVEESKGTLAWIFCAIMCLTGFWLCCCIPFCLPPCNNQIHTCQACHKTICARQSM